MNALLKRIFCAFGISLTVAMTACGGGEGSGVDGNPAFVTSGKWVDGAGAPIAGALVQVELDKVYSTVTGGDGAFTLKTPQNYGYPRYFAGSISKLGYLPTPIFFESNGTSFSSSVQGKAVATRTSTEADVVFSTGIGVTHLGDDSFSGGANSGLQLVASGLVWLEKFALTGSQKQKYKTLCVQMLARGVQSISSKDYVSISLNGQPGTYEVQQMSDSDPAGSFSAQQYCFGITRFAADSIIQVQINSGNDDGRRSDRDDFEFTNVLGQLAP